jgi:hypothetical protein
MPPGTGVPPGLPGPPSRWPPRRGRREGCAGCLVTALLFVLVSIAIGWVVAHHQ